jgi:hypothetical protein
MLSKCANPACCASFRRLTEGKLFQVETCSSSHVQEAENDKRSPQRHTEYFWLCSDCCRFLTLVSSNGQVTTVVLPEDQSESVVLVSKPPLPVPRMNPLSVSTGRRYGS